MEDSDAQVGKKVKRKAGTGPCGLIAEVRDEITGKASTQDAKKIVSVHWDNGTVSFLTPEALEAVKK